MLFLKKALKVKEDVLIDRLKSNIPKNGTTHIKLPRLRKKKKERRICLKLRKVSLYEDSRENSSTHIKLS